jgi:hypothetical protein
LVGGEMRMDKWEREPVLPDSFPRRYLV